MGLVQTRFANPDAISEHHIGMMTMLAYFHYCNKGRAPFQLVKDTTKRPELEAVAELNAEQLKFVEDSADWMRRNCKFTLDHLISGHLTTIHRESRATCQGGA